MVKCPLRDVQDEAPVCFCSKCRQEIYPGETIYRRVTDDLSGDHMCPDCFRAWVESFLDTSPQLVAHALGVDTESYQ